MKLVLQDPTYLKDSITVISELVNEARFTVNKEGLELVAMDPANVAMVVFKLLSSNFSEFQVDDKKELALNLANLKQVLKRSSASDVVSLEVEDNKLKVQLRSNSTRTFHLPLLDLEEREQKIPNLKFPVQAEMPSDVLNQAVEDSTVVSESVTLEIEPQKFSVLAEGDLSKAHVEIPADETVKITSETSANVRAKYSVEYLKKMMQGSKLADKVTVFLNQNYPLKLEYKVVDKLLLNFILAPRVENN
ncbi:proliferating cell nuclear antigen (pcna) [Candidatus Woesearchaeota archaeon]|nr:proliferating cell nuclear antigen (pcna) [Candidatus Woesearchaeota archaeon]